MMSRDGNADELPYLLATELPSITNALLGLGVAAAFAIETERQGAERNIVVLRPVALPASFKQVFQDWAEGRVNFVEFLDG
jgi:hypothetical protein